MNFNKHFDLSGQHAFLGASKYHWINYDEAKLAETYSRYTAVQRGTVLHDFAAQYKMTPEQVLYYSPNCFGTADTISFRNGLLRIHDLKTGVIPAHIEQLLVYAALFCLEYHMKPAEIEMELRIYQNDEVLVHNPEVDEVAPIMDKIITFDKVINRIRAEEE